MMLNILNMVKHPLYQMLILVRYSSITYSQTILWSKKLISFGDAVAIFSAYKYVFVQVEHIGSFIPARVCAMATSSVKSSFPSLPNKPHHPGRSFSFPKKSFSKAKPFCVPRRAASGLIPCLFFTTMKVRTLCFATLVSRLSSWGEWRPATMPLMHL